MTTRSTDVGHDALEALRVAALSLLVAYHLALLAPLPTAGAWERSLTRIGSLGWVGTDLLLALAGFLAIGSRERASSALAWLAHRAWRVLPLFALFLVIYLNLIPRLITASGGSPETLSFSQARHQQGYLWGMATNVLMMQGRRPGAALEPLLTLSVGVQLTLLFALLFSSSRPRLLLYGCGALVLSGIALRLLWLKGDPFLPYSCPLTRGDAFAAGVAAAWLLSEPRWGAWLRRHRRHILLWACACLLLVIGAARGLSVESPIVKLFGYPVIGLFSGAIVLALSQLEHMPRWLRYVASAGRVTYAAYLVKLPALFLVLALLQRWNYASGLRGLALFAGTGCAAIALLAIGLHVIIERPFQRLASLRQAPEGSHA